MNTQTTEIYTFSLPGAVPTAARRMALRRELDRKVSRPLLMASLKRFSEGSPKRKPLTPSSMVSARPPVDRKSTRLNSSHANISHAVFCFKYNTWNNYRFDQHD